MSDQVKTETEDRKQALVTRMAQAKSLLENEVLEAAFVAAKGRFYNEWLGSEDERKQLIAWAKTHALVEVQHELRRFISEGEHAAEVLRRQNEQD